jgi:hypothetical protein
LELYFVPLLAPLVSDCRYRQTLCLPRKAGWFCGILCGSVGSKESRFGVGSGTAAVGKIVVFDVSQVFVLL